MNQNYNYWKDQQCLLETKQKKLSSESNQLKEIDEDNERAQLDEQLIKELSDDDARKYSSIQANHTTNQSSVS